MTFLYADLPPNEREVQLKNLAVKTETRNYSRSLPDSEVQLEEKLHCQDAIEVDELKERAKNIVAEYKTKIDSLETKMKERREIVKNKKRTTTGVLYLIANHENNRMLSYDRYGELVDSRDLLDDEKQGRLFIGPGKDKKDLDIMDAVFETEKDEDKKGGKKAAAKKDFGEQFETGHTNTQATPGDPNAGLSIDEIQSKNAASKKRKTK